MRIVAIVHRSVQVTEDSFQWLSTAYVAEKGETVENFYKRINGSENKNQLMQIVLDIDPEADE
jgi:hypothetical protein